jgi:chromosome partitioning protein
MNHALAARLEMTRTQGAHVIVVGNEKGGSGKSTVALHLAVGLMQLGFRVAVADFDERQKSLVRYLNNRHASAAEWPDALPCPEIYEQPPLRASDASWPERRFETVQADLAALTRHVDFLVIDTPGSVTPLSRMAHSLADTLITPLNDSLIDLDVLARVAAGSLALLFPSQYSRLVLDERHRRLREHGGGMDWIVLRNRIAPIASANSDRVAKVLDSLAPRLGFRVAPGFGERVIYRELFLTGATVLDPIDIVAGLRLTMSHITARIEVRQLFEALWLPHVSREVNARPVPELKAIRAA